MSVIARMRRLLAAAALLTMMSVLPLCAGSHGEGPSEERITIKWFNFTQNEVLSRDDCPVAQELERRFNVDLQISGGRLGSPASRDFVSLLTAKADLPDVFSWGYFSFRDMPNPADVFAELPISLILRQMPGVHRTVARLARDAGLREDEVWQRYTYRDDTVLVIPNVAAHNLYPGITVWRKDILDALGQGVPQTVGDWEEILRAYKEYRPEALAWRGFYAALFPIHDATGESLYAPSAPHRSNWLEPGFIQPGWKLLLGTLQRWHTEGYIEQELGPSYPAAHRRFIEGKRIFEVRVAYEHGDWVCERPYLPGSMQQQCAALHPDAEFVVCPPPVYEGVDKPGSWRNSPFTDEGFGFGKHLEEDPDKLARVMSVVDAIATDRDTFFLTQFGIEGKHWVWEETPVGRYPKRLSTEGLVLGRFWLHANSPYTDEYVLHPRIRDSIERFYGSATAPYSTASVAYYSDPYLIPAFSDSAGDIRALKQQYDALYSKLHSRFYFGAFIPIVFENQPLERLEDFWEYYSKNGGEELEQMLNELRDRCAL